MNSKTATIRTDSIDHAVSDMSDARISGSFVPMRLVLDDGDMISVKVERTEGATVEQWSAAVNGRSYPL